MQSPMQRARQRRLARQARAMQEEQKPYGENRDITQDVAGCADRGEEAGDDYRGDDRQGEIVRPEGGKETQPRRAGKDHRTIAPLSSEPGSRKIAISSRVIGGAFGLDVGRNRFLDERGE